MRQYQTKRQREAAEALAAELDDPATYASAQPPAWREPHPLAWRGVTGCLDPGRVEALQRRRDIDTARYRGVDHFKRPATPAERAHVARQLGADLGHTSALKTRVSVLGGRWRRCWPSLADWQHETVRTTEEGSAA